MEHNDISNKVKEIEDHMTEVRNIFVQIFSKIVKSGKKFTEIPFSMSQMKALSAFHEDRQYTMGELSKNALVKMPSMTEMVDRLEADGIMIRNRDAGDRRVVQVSLTEKGKKIHGKMVGLRRDELSNMFGQLSAGDQDELIYALRKVSVILKKITKSKSQAKKD